MLTAQQNSLDTDSIARKPSLEAKFQISVATILNREPRNPLQA